MKISSDINVTLEFEDSNAMSIFGQVCHFAKLDLGNHNYKENSITLFNISEGFRNEVQLIFDAVKEMCGKKFEHKELVQYTDVEVPDMTKKSFDAFKKVYDFMLQDFSFDCAFHRNNGSARFLVPNKLLSQFRFFLNKS
jgi:hypothetical protein